MRNRNSMKSRWERGSVGQNYPCVICDQARILPSSTSPTYPTRHSSLCAEKNLWPEACTFSLLFCQHRSGIQHNAKKNIRIQFSGMRGVNVIHLCVYVSGSAITSANLATAEDNLFNLERRGGHQRLLHRRCRTPTRGLLVSPIF